MASTDMNSKKFVLIGDIGGTNARLQLISLSGPTLETKEIVKEKKADAQKGTSLMSCIDDFMSDVPETPDMCVLGVAGPVVDNAVEGTNLGHWGETNGNEIGKKFKSCFLINDFEAAGYGVTRLQEEDCDALGDTAKIPLEEGENSVKAVIGPGTGLGQGILIRKEEGGMYEPLPSEGGHVDFAVITEEDWDLAKFARKYIEKKKGEKIGRLSVERLCAGPAVPLLYSFMKEKYPEDRAVLEMETPEYGPAKEFDDITAEDITKMGMEHEDPLCMKVIEKFSEIFGTETGNLALKTLPYGGIYIVGGVANGIREYLLDEKTENTFMNAFYNKVDKRKKL